MATDHAFAGIMIGTDKTGLAWGHKKITEVSLKVNLHAILQGMLKKFMPLTIHLLHWFSLAEKGVLFRGQIALDQMDIRCHQGRGFLLVKVKCQMFSTFLQQDAHLLQYWKTGQLKQWGWNDCGGDSSNVKQSLTSNIVSIVSNSGAFAAKTSHGKAIVWGSHMHGGAPGSNILQRLQSGVKELHAYQSSFVAIFESREIKIGVGSNGIFNIQHELQRDNAFYKFILKPSEIQNIRFKYDNDLRDNETYNLFPRFNPGIVDA